MNRYLINGTILYLLKCPKAPDVEPCDPPAMCPGHEFKAEIGLYVDAPDVPRAILAALGKLKTAYPWPLFAGDPAIEEIQPPGARVGRPIPGAEPLPGMAEFLKRRPKPGMATVE